MSDRERRDRGEESHYWFDYAQAPTTITVFERDNPKPVLYDPKGNPLARDKRIGFIRNGVVAR